MKENLPMKNEDNIFSKIIVFFKKLFYKSDKNTNNEFNKVETENISAPKTEAPKKSYIEIEREKSQRYNYLLDLQSKFELGKIKEEDIDKADADEIRKIYEDQIAILKRK